MIPWWWLIPAAWFGAIAAVVILSMCMVAGRADEQAELWHAEALKSGAER